MTIETSDLIVSAGGPLEKRDQDGNAIFWISFRQDDPSKYNFDYSMKTWTMVGDAWAAENGSANGITLVLDQKNFTMGHMLRISLATVQKMNYFNKVRTSIPPAGGCCENLRINNQIERSRETHGFYENGI